MARCPFARWRPLPESYSQPAIRPTQFILHSAVDHPGRTDLRGFFDNPGVGVESHFWVYLDGSLDQFVDTQVRADANSGANRRPDGTGAVSVETEDEGNPDTRPWTGPQLQTLARLGRWLSDVHPIPLRPCPSPDSPGVGYHTMFGAPSPWTSVRGKTCPGRVRVNQFPTVLALMGGSREDIMRRGDNSTRVAAWQSRLAWLGIQLTPDGDFGPKTVEATKRAQGMLGLAQDGEVHATEWALLVATRAGNELTEHARDDNRHGGSVDLSGYAPKDHKHTGRVTVQ